MKKAYRLGEEEARFADLIWENEPIGSGRLVKLSEETLNWKKSTTYTVLKKLCERGIFENQNAVVTARVKRDEFYGIQGRQFIEDVFDGSLPGFLAAFIGGKRLSVKEAEDLKALIDTYKEES